jgi:hypothetical protein
MPSGPTDGSAGISTATSWWSYAATDISPARRSSSGLGEAAHLAAGDAGARMLPEALLRPA